MEGSGDVNGSVVAHSDASLNGSVHNGDAVRESKELDVDFLIEFDSYWEVVKDRLTISRMVSDSVIRGMVNAVEQEAADRIAQKELELARLKKMMKSYHSGSGESKLSLKHYEPDIEEAGVFSSLSDALMEHDKIQESLRSLENASKGKFKNLGTEIDKMRGHSSIRRVNSGSSESVESGSILQEGETREWTDVDKALDSLRMTLDTAYEQVANFLCSSKASLCQWQLEREYQDEVEHMVVTNCIRNLKEQFEERLWDQNAQCYAIKNVNWNEKINEISSLRKELDAISKFLSNPETGMLNSHSSLEINDDLSNDKRTDHLHRKVSGNQASSSTSLWEGNGEHEESVITVPENLDAGQLMHMSKEELVSYFKLEMTKMKRNFDYKLAGITDECFRFKREYLKEKGSLPSKKDKEFDVLRKKIPDVIVKLDSILVENEKLTPLNKNGETLGILKDRLESLVSENHQLRDSLSDQKKEVNHLSSQVSDAIIKMAHQSLIEDDLLKKVENLESAVEDATIEAIIYGDVYNCFIREEMSQIKQISEDLEMEQIIWKNIYDLIFRDAFCNMSHLSKGEFEDSDLESLVMEGLCAVLFKEVFSEAMEEMLKMESMVDEKEKLRNETAAELAREKEKNNQISQELNIVRDQSNLQQIIISKFKDESSDMKIKLELQKVEASKSNQKLDQAMKDLRNEKIKLLAAIKEKEDILSSTEANEKEHRKQMESIIILVEGLSKAVSAFQCRVAEDVKRSNLRLESLSTQCSSLHQMVNVLKREGLQYKKNLESTCSDLEKAETEVDLLGDEVEVLLGLLEKIYIALDHYSPILKHYTGIMEILKLVRRELSGESTNTV